MNCISSLISLQNKEIKEELKIEEIERFETFNITVWPEFGPCLRHCYAR